MEREGGGTLPAETHHVPRGQVNSGCYAHSLTGALWKVLSTSFTVRIGNHATSVMETNMETHTGSSTSAEFSPHPSLQRKLWSPVS